MENLGAFLRERYVDSGDFVNAAYDQFEVEARADLSGCLRRIISVEAFLEAMFPGAPIPVLTDSGEVGARTRTVHVVWRGLRTSAPFGKLGPCCEQDLTSSPLSALEIIAEQVTSCLPQ